MERSGIVKTNGSFRETLALVVLNASRNVLLRKARAETLLAAGYYTSSAETPEEAVALAAQMKCPVAVICHSFTLSELYLIQMGIKEHAPATTVIFLGKSEDQDPETLLSTVKAALAARESASHRYWPS
jgi:hypothetical protein